MCIRDSVHPAAVFLNEEHAHVPPEAQTHEGVIDGGGDHEVSCGVQVTLSIDEIDGGAEALGVEGFFDFKTLGADVHAELCEFVLLAGELKITPAGADIAAGVFLSLIHI